MLPFVKYLDIVFNQIVNERFSETKNKKSLVLALPKTDSDKKQIVCFMSSVRLINAHCLR